jgi:hypothetical protein
MTTTLQNPTDREAALILAALESATGGGSETFTLVQKLFAQTDIRPEPELIGILQENASDEFHAYLDGE